MTTTQHAPTRADLAAAIADGKRKYDRMPAHWEARRSLAMKAIMVLVDQLLALEKDTSTDRRDSDR